MCEHRLWHCQWQGVRPGAFQSDRILGFYFNLIRPWRWPDVWCINRLSGIIWAKPITSRTIIPVKEVIHFIEIWISSFWSVGIRKLNPTSAWAWRTIWFKWWVVTCKCRFKRPKWSCCIKVKLIACTNSPIILRIILQFIRQKSAFHQISRKEGWSRRCAKKEVIGD